MRIRLVTGWGVMTVVVALLAHKLDEPTLFIPAGILALLTVATATMGRND